MHSANASTALPAPRQLVIAIIGGFAIAAVDSVASGGEISPIVVAALLFAFAGVLGGLVHNGRILCTLAAWLCLPFVHFVKHVLHLPDTLHPNTYRSISYLAVFTFVVAIAGMASGWALARHGNIPDEYRSNPRLRRC